MPNESKHPRIVPPPVVLLGCLFLGIIVQRRYPREIAHYPFEAGIGLGSVLLVGAAVFGTWAFLTMRRHKTPIEPWLPPRHLVTTGPFHYTRNPLYVTLTTILLAIAVMTNSLWIALSTGLFVELIHWFVIRREEVILANVFGGAYDAYKKRVRRWL